MTVREWGLGTKVDEPLEARLREAVREAIPIIWNGRFLFTTERKEGIGDRKNDFCTSIDREAQATVVEFLGKHFGEFGFLCEEDGIEPWDGREPYFTVDGMDGTIPFKHGNWHGVSVMVSAVNHGKVIAACIGDVTTGDLYSYGPNSDGVAHTSEGHSKLLPTASPNEELLTLLRRPVRKHLPVTQRLVDEMDDHQVTNESLGVWTPRLWKREARIGVLWHGTKETAWDMAPVIGISERLGYVFLKSAADGESFEVFEPEIPTTPRERGHDLVIVHRNDLSLVEHLVRN